MWFKKSPAMESIIDISEELSLEAKMSLSSAAKTLSESDVVKYVFSDLVQKLQEAGYSTEDYSSDVHEKCWYMIQAIRSLDAELEFLGSQAELLQQEWEQKNG